VRESSRSRHTVARIVRVRSPRVAGGRPPLPGWGCGVAIGARRYPEARPRSGSRCCSYRRAAAENAGVTRARSRELLRRPAARRVSTARRSAGRRRSGRRAARTDATFRRTTRATSECLVTMGTKSRLGPGERSHTSSGIPIRRRYGAADGADALARTSPTPSPRHFLCLLGASAAGIRPANSAMRIARVRPTAAAINADAPPSGINPIFVNASMKKAFSAANTTSHASANDAAFGATPRGGWRARGTRRLVSPGVRAG